MTKSLALTLLLIVLAGCSASDPSASSSVEASRELPPPPSFDIAMPASQELPGVVPMAPASVAPVASIDVDGMARTR